ncbi:MAG: tyrosine--tRNA ligase [Firmicutes bacterium]|nr:tyrosine--tRNA ligase [Bacillota bacterium]
MNVDRAPLTDEEEQTIVRQAEKLRSMVRDVVPEDGLYEKLRRAAVERRPLRIKLGMDPTAPDVHLGHAVPLSLLRELQEMGHEVDLVIGDFTARIGDPSGRSETRKPMTPEQIAENAKSYADQVFRILDPARTTLHYNSSWLSPLTLGDVLEITATYTVARMLERDDFSKRFQQNLPIGVHEFLYPLMQGYDSVALHSDIEVGGTDQRFNLIVGRHLQENFGQVPQAAIMVEILEGTDGKQKMSKSLGNYIGLNEPPDEMFGKVMSIPDGLMPRYYQLVSGLPLQQIQEILQALEENTLHPRDAKLRLAGAIVQRFWGAEAAEQAEARFVRIFHSGDLPEQMPEYAVASQPIWLPRLMVSLGLTHSHGEARRLIEQGAVMLNGNRLRDPSVEIVPQEGDVLQVGKRRFARLKIRA